MATATGGAAVAARALAAASALFWTIPFFGLIDLAVPVDETPGFYDSYLLETGWGVLYTVVIGAAFLGLAFRPRMVLPLAQVAVAAACLVLTALASGSWAQLAPGIVLLLSCAAYALLLHGRLTWPFGRARVHLDPVVGAVALSLVAPASVFAVDMVLGYWHNRPPRDDDTWGIDHWPTQAAVGLAVAAVAVLVAVGVRDRWTGTAVSGGCVAVTAAWFGGWSVVYPDHAGSAGRVGGTALVLWAAVFAGAVTWRLGKGASSRRAGLDRPSESREPSTDAPVRRGPGRGATRSRLPAATCRGHTEVMDLDRAREFVRTHHRAVLATRTASGIQQSPVLVGVDDQGRLTVSSRETAFKTKNLRADPWAQLCVMSDGFFGDWVYVEGVADVVSLPEAMEPLVAYYRGISGEAEDWDDYRAGMERERRVIIRITPTRAGPDRQG